MHSLLFDPLESEQSSELTSDGLKTACLRLHVSATLLVQACGIAAANNLSTSRTSGNLGPCRKNERCHLDEEQLALFIGSGQQRQASHSTSTAFNASFSWAQGSNTCRASSSTQTLHLGFQGQLDRTTLFVFFCIRCTFFGLSDCLTVCSVAARLSTWLSACAAVHSNRAAASSAHYKCVFVLAGHRQA